MKLKYLISSQTELKLWHGLYSYTLKGSVSKFRKDSTKHIGE